MKWPWRKAAPDKPRCFFGWRTNEIQRPKGIQIQKRWVEEHVGPRMEIIGRADSHGVRDVWVECMACGGRIR